MCLQRSYGLQRLKPASLRFQRYSTIHPSYWGLRGLRPGREAVDQWLGKWLDVWLWSTICPSSSLGTMSTCHRWHGCACVGFAQYWFSWSRVPYDLRTFPPSTPLFASPPSPTHNITQLNPFKSNRTGSTSSPQRKRRSVRQRCYQGLTLV